MRNKKIIIVTHSFSTGPAQELEKYLIHEPDEFAFISHPFHYAKQKFSTGMLYKNGRISKSYRSFPMFGPEMLFYVKDFVYSFIFFFRFRRIFDLFIGAGNFNAFVGLILKRLGLVKKVVYYTIDYVPHKRFRSSFFSSFYLYLDKICCYYCDCIWNLSPQMPLERQRQGVLLDRCAPQMLVPNGNNFSQINRLPISEIKRFAIVHMGHLLEKQGLQLVLEALPEIIVSIPSVTLFIVGEGPYEEKLKIQSKELGLNSHVQFLGFIPDHRELERILAQCAVGVATYVPSPESYSKFADPGKIKAYMACGLPVIVTKVPYIANEVAQRKAGFAIEYNRLELKEVLLRLLTDNSLFAEYRENAINFASEFDWAKIFDKALTKTLV